MWRYVVLGCVARVMRYGGLGCGAVRCGAVRCGAVRCGAVRCGAVRCVEVRRIIGPARAADG